MTNALVKLQSKFASIREERGATAVEYGLMVALIAIVIIAAVVLLGTSLSNLFSTVSQSV
jgi:pilus assembly protein Flp/PilA